MIVQYFGHAEDIIQPAVKLGWEFDEDDYLDNIDGSIDWDRLLAAATEFLQEQGHTVEYL